MKEIAYLCLFLLLQVSGLGMHVLHAQEQMLATGIIFYDRSGDRVFDENQDIPLKGIPVSNGRDIVFSDSNGIYEIPIRQTDVVFVIKPRNWQFPKDENQQPLFYYTHSQEVTGGDRYKGLLPTGPLPESLDFPLYPVDEPETFDVLVFGDTQPRTMQEIFYMTHDVFPELIGVNAEFAINLGDVVFDDINLFEPVKDGLATIGVPWHYVLGNHDLDYSAACNISARGPWYRSFGPSYYSFSYGSAHFIVLDNISWIVEEGEKQYKTGLGSEQMNFFRQEVSRIDDDKLLVLLTHIPWVGSTEWDDEHERKEFLEILSLHPNSLSLVSHRHRHHHLFIDEEWGFMGEGGHHMIVAGTVGGAWWTGMPDEYGIPHAMMSDGTPTSYSFLQIDGNQWKLRFKAARRPDDFQMHIHAPDMLGAHETPGMMVTANIFNALPSAEVKMRIGESNDWVSMHRQVQPDPVRAEAMERERMIEDFPWRSMSRSYDSEHIWQAVPEYELEPGAHVIHVKSTDKWWVYEGYRVIYVE